MKVRRFWINQKKRAQFYGQLGQLIFQVCAQYWLSFYSVGHLLIHSHFVLQDVSFLILAGAYASGAGVLNVPAFFSILVSLVGIITYLVYLILERENISSYLLWLKGEVGKLWSKATNKGPAQTGRQAQPTQPHAHPRSPHGSSESEQSEDGSQVGEQECLCCDILPSLPPSDTFIPTHSRVLHRTTQTLSMSHTKVLLDTGCQ